jgi:hypothetical protein
VGRRAVAHTGGVPRPREELVQLDTVHVEILGFDRPAQCWLQDGNRLPGAPLAQVDLRQLEVRSGVAGREGEDRLPKLGSGPRVVTAGDEQQTPNVMMEPTVASIPAPQA